MRTTHWLLATLCLAIAATGSRAAGTIEETGTTYSLGVAPTQGTLTKNASAPAAVAPAIPPLGTLGAIGTFSSPLPAFPGGGSGAGGAFVGAASATAPGGTFNYSSFTVNAGVVLTYTGSVTILVTGNATILGTVETNAPNASLTIRSAGIVSLGAIARVQTLMGASAVTIDAAQDFTTTAGASVNAVGGDIDITAHGLNATAGNVSLAGTQVFTSSAAVRLRAQGAVSANGNVFVGSAPGGSALIQAFGGNVTFGPTGVQVGDAGAGVVVEASGAVTFTGGSGPQGIQDGIFAEDGGVSVRAFGGDVQFLSGAEINAASEGDVTLAASASVRISHAVKAGGAITATAHGGDIALESPAGQPVDAGQGIVLDASNDVLIDGAKVLGGDLLHVRAIGGDVVIGTITEFGGADTDVRAAGAITAAFFGPGFTGALRFSAGAGGIALGNALVTAQGKVDLVATGPVTMPGAFPGSLRAFDDLTITSCDAGIDVTGAVVGTLETQDVSGDVTLQSFAGATGAVIDVAGSTISTEDAAVRSGSIRILVHDAKLPGGGGGSVSIDSFLLPKSVVVKTNTKTPAKSKITISGIFDEGLVEPCFTEPLTLEVGTKTFSSSGMIAKGKSFEHVEPGLVFRVSPAKTASSRGTFLIVRTGDLTNEVNRDGSLRLHIVGTRLDVTGTVTLASGKYTLGKVRGRLAEPCIFPQSVLATLKGAGQDKVSLVMGFETAGYDVTVIPCVKVGIGDAFTAEIPRASFKPKGQTLVFKGNVNGITSVVFDIAHERITVSGKGMTLIGLTATSGPVKLTITLDTIALGVDERSVNVKLVGAGKTLKY